MAEPLFIASNASEIPCGHGAEPVAPFVDEHPFATYFDVHQGYRVLTDSYVSFILRTINFNILCQPQWRADLSCTTASNHLGISKAALLMLILLGHASGIGRGCAKTSERKSLPPPPPAAWVQDLGLLANRCSTAQKQEALGLALHFGIPRQRLSLGVSPLGEL